MDHTTTTDIAALEAEIAALEAEIAAIEAEDAAQRARVGALLATGSAAVRLADLQLQAAQASRDLAVQTRYQRRIARAIGA